MKLLNFFKISHTSLIQRSKNIMNVFTKTVEDLKNLNTELYEKKRETETKISELNSINEEINATMESNKNIITKIENFFNN